jgi:hypothetical protein
MWKNSTPAELRARQATGKAGSFDVQTLVLTVLSGCPQLLGNRQALHLSVLGHSDHKMLLQQAAGLVSVKVWRGLKGLCQ